MSLYYLNEDHTYRACSLEEWSDQIEHRQKNKTKHIAHDLINGKTISTIWLGINLNYGEGPLHLFETMVFDEAGLSIYLERFSTWDKAEEGHRKAIEWVNNGCLNGDLE